MASRSKRKPRKPKLTGQPTRIQNIADMVIAGLITGLIQMLVKMLIEHFTA